MNNTDKTTLKKQCSQSHLEQSLNMLTSPQPGPVTIYFGPGKDASAGLSKADLDLVQRLEHLRRHSREEVPSDEEMGRRLARLKGLDDDYYKQSSGVLVTEKRSNVEQADNLILQMSEQVSLEMKLPQPDDDIAARLARLRGEEVKGGLNPTQVGHHQPVENAVMEDLETVTIDEIEALIATTTKGAMKTSTDEVAALALDPTINKSLKKAAKTRKVKRTKRHDSEEEKLSDSDDSDIALTAPGLGDTRATRQEEAEVQRLVALYMKRANERKEKGEDDSDDSDLPSSDDEKFSSSEGLCSDD